MKKQDLATLALLGISAGLLIGGCQQQSHKKNPQENTQGSLQQLTSTMQSFYSSLSPEAQKKFIALDNEHKMMALEMAQQSCQGKNNCAGKGGCATQKHDCAGHNSCKGQGGAPVQDINRAVNVQYENQMRGYSPRKSPLPSQAPSNSYQLQTGGISGQLSPDMESFYNRLSTENQKKFMALDAQHKMMAVQMLEQSCKGKNDCAGLGGCRTAQHDCAGKNDCKGQGGPAIQDANRAVQAQYSMQGLQRERMAQAMSEEEVILE